MGSVVRYLNPEGLLDASRYGFSHVSVAHVGQVVHVAGQTAVDDRGVHDPDDDLRAQARKALRNVATALHSIEATLHDLAALRVYVVGLDASLFPAVSTEISTFLAGAEPPPATWVGVTSLLSPEALIEIEAVAVINAS